MKRGKRADRASRHVPGLSRRSFLSIPLLSASLIAPGVSRAASGWSLEGSSAALEPVAGSEQGRVSIAYWAGSEHLESLDDLTHTCGRCLVDKQGNSVDATACTVPVHQPLMDAAGLRQGDLRFANRPARLRIMGLFQTNGAKVDNLAPMAMYVRGGRSGCLPFYAWGLEQGNVPSVSNPSEFHIPVDRVSGLTLSFDVGEHKPGSAVHAAPTPTDPAYFEDHLQAHFALDGGPGTFKLRRGVYLISWTDSKHPLLPDWRGYVIEAAQPHRPELDEDREQDAERTEIAEHAGSVTEFGETDAAPDLRTFTRLTTHGFIGPWKKFGYLMLAVDFAEDSVAGVPAGNEFRIET